ncbi:MAG: fluoride efflux transporter CrcB [Microcystaceae cyanobacterium]
MSLFEPLEKVFTFFTPLDPAIRTPIAIALGAIPGALCRFYISTWLTQWLGEGFPYGTFIVNLSGSLLMGFIVTYALERVALSPDVRVFLAVGFLGSYTTFSTYALDTVLMLSSKPLAMTLFYSLGSAGLGAIALVLGGIIARQMP